MFRNTFHRPISSPIHDLRPARETCEECHWPAKHHGDKLRVFARFETDEENTGSYTAMLLKTGGGRLDLGNQSGIHWWHIYSDNRIRYVASDDRREEIGWVELTTPEGEVRTYTRDGETVAGEVIAQQARTMDCIDCHNRPTHNFATPDRSLDAVLESQPELMSLPFFKREALASIEHPYTTHALGVEGVRTVVDDYYRQTWPEIYAEQHELVDLGSQAASRVYERSSFPEMKTDWTTHPNHIGHEESPGCWRCHDDEMATEDGEHVISIDCDICHSFLVEDHSEPPVLSDLID